MNRTKNVILIYVILTVCFSCSYREPVNIIMHYKNIDQIQIIALENNKKVIKKNITDKREIQKFLLLFKPTKRINTSTTFPIEDFHKNGEIIIYYANNTTPLNISLDIYNGYCITLHSKQYYERYTYQLGRYLTELFYENEIRSLNTR